MHSLTYRVLTTLRRLPGSKRILQWIYTHSPATRTQLGLWQRPHYAFGVNEACRQAVALGLSGISVIELGVAGGNGLLALEQVASALAQLHKITIDVYGLDSGTGMPHPIDYRDLPHVWAQGFYQMDAGALKRRLKHATLILGDVQGSATTIRNDLRHPVGFVAFDLDYYSSTQRSFALFEGGHECALPRVFCYFDNILYPIRACHSEYTGELLAIREFNQLHNYQKLTPLRGLDYMFPVREAWQEQIYVLHNFAHPSYNTLLTANTETARQLPLSR